MQKIWKKCDNPRSVIVGRTSGLMDGRTRLNSKGPLDEPAVQKENYKDKKAYFRREQTRPLEHQ